MHAGRDWGQGSLSGTYNGCALQVGYSREYLEKLVEGEQKRKEDAAGIQYEYNTEVCQSLPFSCISVHFDHICEGNGMPSAYRLFTVIASEV